MLDAKESPEIAYTKSDWVYKIKYPISDKKSFQKYLVESWKHGIDDDEILNRCYPNIKNDIESLISEGWIRVIMVSNKPGRTKVISDQTRVLFACDRENDKEVEGVTDDLPQNCHDFISEIWEKQLGDNNLINWEQILQNQPGLLSN